MEFIIVKTTVESKKVQELILKNNKYKIPQIIATKIKCGDKNYLNWVGENC
ncbi:MAG: divalent cation tolerance protein CutA [Candidatus Pacearchaeota archaeon]|jgi:uncharacterized protein involved in tolerance to divalent cations